MKRRIAVLLIIIIAAGACLNTPAVNTKAGRTIVVDEENCSETVVYRNSQGVNKDIITISWKSDTDFIFEGNHVDSMTGKPAGYTHITYETVGFSFTLSDRGGNVTSGKYGELLIENGGINKSDVSVGGYIKTTYTVSYAKIIEMAKKILGITDSDLAKESGVTLYLSNIFITEDSTMMSDGVTVKESPRHGGRKYYNLSDMRAAEGWGSATYEVLSAYYGIPITLKKQYFTVNKVFTDCGNCAYRYLKNGRDSSARCDKHTGDNSIWFVYHESEANVDSVTFTKYSSGTAFSRMAPEMLVHNESEWQIDKDSAYLVYQKGDTVEGLYKNRELLSLTRKSSGNYWASITRTRNLDSCMVVVYAEKETEESGGEKDPEKSEERTETQEPAERPNDSQSSFTGAVSYMQAAPEGMLTSDIFDARSAIPSTEVLSAGIRTAEYLINVGLKTVTGTKVYEIPVSVPYTLEWKNEDDEYESETGTVTGTVYVPYDYSFTELTDLSYYTLDYGIIKCKALPYGEVKITPKGYSPCDVSYTVHAQGEEGHLLAPNGAAGGVVAEAVVIKTEDNEKPAPPGINSLEIGEVREKAGKIKVRNDFLAFGGNVVMEDGYKEERAEAPGLSAVRAPEKTGTDILKEMNLAIPAELRNGSYSANGQVVYKLQKGYNPGPDKLTFGFDADSVAVHTPVFCSGIIGSDNAKYVQLANPDISAVPMVVGRSFGAESKNHEYDSCDFTVSVSNFGYHSSAKGYGSRDYGMNLSGKDGGSYIASDYSGYLRNEVSFPFDIYVDAGGDHNTANDYSVPAGNWITIGKESIRAYIPDYVSEGIYYVDFRTIAVNGNEYDRAEQGANTSPSCYVATDRVKVQVSGKLFGLTLSGTDDKHDWDGVFENDGYYYTSGISNELGIERFRDKRLILPTISGSHPENSGKGVLKAGYRWKFNLFTTGSVMAEKGAYIDLVPTFTFEKDGEYTEADVYYSESNELGEWTMVKIGSDEDKLNYRRETPANPLLNIPDKELTALSLDLGVSKDNLKDIYGKIYTYGYIRTSDLFKTFVGDEGRSKNSRQKYYIEYSLPTRMYVVSKGTDVYGYMKKYGINGKEKIRLTGGNLIVNFCINAYDSEGKLYLSYFNTENAQKYGHCGMWDMEGFMKERIDAAGKSYRFRQGDTLMIFTDITREDDNRVIRVY